MDASKFTLTIELGNDAMQSGFDVAEALESVSRHLEPISGCLGEGDEGSIRDLNGNTVGSWEVTA